MVTKLILAKPRGFCAGVERAIEIVEQALEIYGKPIYVRHQIVHNEFVVQSLKKKGAIFVEDFNDVPQGSKLILSAHGTDPAVKKEAEERGLKIIDATCPLVTKVHIEATRYFRDGYFLILVGHKGHQEVIGTMGVAPMKLVESVEDVSRLQIKNREKIAYLSQTTLSLDDTKGIVTALQKKFPTIVSPPKGDICYATQNRQNAVKELGKQVDCIFVIGSEMSSNSKRLVETAHFQGIQSYLISDASAIKKGWLKKVKTLGLTSGASAPEILVHEVLDSLKKMFPSVIVEECEFLKENIRFSLPPEVSVKIS